MLTLACAVRVGDVDGFIAIKALQVDLTLYPPHLPLYRQGAPTDLHMMQPPHHP
jgi:hypothetical protein